MSQTSTRQYTRITQEQFENLLGTVAEFTQATDADAEELVYDIALPADDLTVRIYSTIQDGESRGCGNDAIRLTIFDHETNSVIGGRKKTLRLGPTDSNPAGWWGNFRPKLEDLMANWRNYYYDRCEECGHRMAHREGEHGEFVGCTNYPTCRNTTSL